MKLIFSLIFITLQISAYVEGIQLICDFKMGEHGYKCDTESLTITSRNDRTIDSIIGEHLEGKTNEDVKFFRNYGHVMNYFPLQLTKYFKNVEAVQINFANLKRITATDLEQFGDNLKIFWIGNNIVEVVESDLFRYTPNVESIGFSPQKIKHVEKGALSGLTNLHSLWFSQNPCGRGVNVENDRLEILNLVYTIETTCQDTTLLFKTQIDELREDFAHIKSNLNK